MDADRARRSRVNLLEPVWPGEGRAGDGGPVGRSTAVLDRRPPAFVSVPDLHVAPVRAPYRDLSSIRTASPVPTLRPQPMARPQRPGPGPAHRVRRERTTGWRRWRLLTAYGCGVVLLVAAVWVAADTTAQLHRTDAELATVQARVQQTVARIQVTRVALHKVSVQSAAAARMLGTESSELATDQSHLSAAEADVTTNGVNISDLNTCLSGVQQALNEISLGDRPDAVASLDRVGPTCKAAEPVA